MQLPGLKWKSSELLLFALALAAYAVFAKISGTLCVFRGITGLPCPGCGLTTAAFLVLNGNLHAAYSTHPGIILIPGCIFFILIYRNRPEAKRWAEIYFSSTILFLVFFFVYRVVKNFPDGPYPMIYEPKNLLRLGWDFLFNCR